MNWIDWIVGGVLLALAAWVVIRSVIRKRRGETASCIGCPYSDSCSAKEDCPMKKPKEGE